MKYPAISLFSSGGIGDLALREAGIEVFVASELLPDRAMVYSHNHPDTKMFVGDIWDHIDDVIDAAKQSLGGNELFMLYATPPCQGMSKNGQGKLLNAIRRGDKGKFDERNRLIIPVVRIAKALQPEIVLLENVPEMANTCIVDDRNDRDVINIMDYIRRELDGEYVLRHQVVEFADYGVPQRRKRLITIISRIPSINQALLSGQSHIPPATHSQRGGGGRKKWITVRDTIGSLPPLDARNPESARSLQIPLHKVPLLDDEKYYWVSNTPPEGKAFDNQCVNPDCGFNGNPIHGATRDHHGVNRANEDTPLYCLECGALLPRPWVVVDGEKRIMKGYTSAYKRMNWDLPSSTLTRNLSYACSDNKLHPCQNRVLSLHEATLLHTISEYRYEWKRADGRRVSDKLIREIIGESIPPKGLEPIVKHILAMYEGTVLAHPRKQLGLF